MRVPNVVCGMNGVFGVVNACSRDSLSILLFVFFVVQGLARWFVDSSSVVIVMFPAFAGVRRLWVVGERQLWDSNRWMAASAGYN